MPEAGIQCFSDAFTAGGAGQITEAAPKRPNSSVERRASRLAGRARTPGAPLLPLSCFRLSSVKRKIRVYAAELLAEVSGDQLAVETAIFNEDFACLRSGDDHSGNIDPRNIRFQALRIADGTKLVRGKFDAYAAEKIVVGMIPSEREHEIVFQTTRSGWSAQRDIVTANFLHRAVEVRDNFA